MFRLIEDMHYDTLKNVSFRVRRNTLCKTDNTRFEVLLNG